VAKLKFLGNSSLHKKFAMISQQQGSSIYKLRHTRKDVGVAIVVIAALLGGALLRQSVTQQTVAFADAGTGLRMSLPAGYAETSTMLPDAIVKMSDQYGASPYKSNVVVESLEIDKSNIPTLQQLMDRRVELRSKLTGYHFIGNNETSINGHKAMELRYAYVDQPIDQPRRVSLPVVVIGREYIALSTNRVYYITTAVPEQEADTAGADLQRVVETITIP
jgi:hypothetical protein